ncbi:crystal protein-like [Ylistrum balloti]|uniref:crystal protein-like n=1 Tax=Ylistrum balloti TaxID=509963 RepID=UPI002905DC61|nr:crystal protein-like [Ylistrum balloti]
MKIHLAVLMFVIGVSSSDTNVVIQTRLGKLKGVKTDTNLKFLGIPYAESPTGKLRWADPVARSPWSPSVYDATKTKPGCPQKGCFDMNPAFVCPTEVSEDCLYLNVFAPVTANSSSSKYPVLVYLHGGNFVHMSSNAVLFDGSVLAAKGEIIVVTLDYRLGSLGFLVTATSNMAPGARGNYGILDQRLALKWVKDNIRDFGGDPNQVTLSGQSAGAQSAVIHMMTQDSSQYFRSVILESSPFSIPYKTRVEALYLGDLLADGLGCPRGDVNCMANKSADDIATVQHNIRKDPTSIKLLDFFEPLGPFVDGVVVPYQPLEAMNRGIIADIPILIGTTSEETRIYVYEAWTKNLTVPMYSAALLGTFGPNHITKVLEMYPPVHIKDEREDLQHASTDFIFSCSKRNFSRVALNQNKNVVFNYVFDHAFSFDGWGPNFTCCKGHVCHGSEIPYMFQPVFKNMTLDADEKVMADSLAKYWSNFVKTGNPNKGGTSPILQWPEYNNVTNFSALQFSTPRNYIVVNVKQELCDFWDTVGYKA